MTGHAITNQGTSPHPSSGELAAYGLGRLDASAAEAVYRHLDECPVCRAAVEATEDDTLASLVRDAATPPADGLAPTFSGTVGPDEGLLRDHPRYRLEELLGAGGMGVVYRARHQLMARTVALKVLHRQLTEKPAALERFHREVKAVAALSHPNIVSAYDADQVGERHFLVMEYVPGVTLARLVTEQGPLDAARACDYVRQAALGLQHAHERGLVHRDLKPSNLIVTPDGQVKILDLGLARLGEPVECGSGDLTDAGTVMGSVDYLAPEQADDPRQADIRADIYSLGCTLYQLLTGRPPFPEGTSMQRLKAHAQRRPAPLAREGVPMPAGLDRVVARMLAKDPQRRYQTPGEMAEALAPYADGVGRPPTRHRRWLIAVVAFFLIVAGVAYRVATDHGDIVIESDDPDVQVLVKQDRKLVEILDAKSKQKVTLDSGEYTLSLNGDAEGLNVDMPPTLVLRRGDTQIVTIKRLPADEIAHWKAHNRETVLALDPAGKILASTGEDGIIRLWNVTDGKELRSWQGHAGHALNLAFSPDGNILASGGFDHTVKWWGKETGKLQGSVEFEAMNPWPLCFAADGKSLFAGVNANGKACSLRRVDLAAQKDKELANFDTFVFNLALGADPQMLAVATCDSKVRIWNTATEKETLQFQIASRQANALVFHPKAKLLAVGGENALGLWDLSGNLKVTMAGLKQPVIPTAFSPDGKLLVSGGGSWRSPDGTGEIKVWDTATGKALATLGHDVSCVNRVVVATDGKTCFTSHFDGTIRQWRLPKLPEKK